MQPAVNRNTSNRSLGPVLLAAGRSFMEVHEAPERAPSDGPNALPLRTYAVALECVARYTQTGPWRFRIGHCRLPIADRRYEKARNG